MENNFVLISDFGNPLEDGSYYIVKRGDYSLDENGMYIYSSIGKFITAGDRNRMFDIFPEPVHGIFIHIPNVQPLPEVYFKKLLRVYHENSFTEDVLPYLIGGRIL